MNTIKWELEDLSFATLYPKVYDEIVRLVAERAPAREEYLAGVRDAGQRRPARGQDQGHGHRPAEALLLHLPEDDRARPRLRGDLRPRRRPGARRLGARLLRGARRAARALEPGARAVQGLHRDAEVQPVPVAAHDGDRARGQAGRDPDPHPHDAPPGRVRRRRALEVQGGPRRRRRPRRSGGDTEPATTWPGCASCSTGRRRPPTRASSSTRCASRSAPARSTSSRRRARSSALPAGATPVDFAYAVHTEVGHRTHGRPGQRPARAAGEHARERRRRRGASPRRPTTPGPSRDWLTFVKSPRARNKIRQWFTKERREEAIEQGKDAIAKAMRKQNLPLQRLMTHESLTDVAERAALRRRRRAVRRGRRGPRLGPARRAAGWSQSLGGEEGASEDLAEATTPTRAPAPAAQRRPRRRGRGRRRRLGQAGQVLHPGAGRPDRRLRHARQRGLGAPRRLHQRRVAAAPSRSGIIEVEWAPTSASVFLVQIQVEALDRSGCSPTSRGCCPTTHVNILSATRRDVARPGGDLAASPSRWATRPTSTTCCNAVRRIDGVFDVYRVTGGKATKPEPV